MPESEPFILSEVLSDFQNNPADLLSTKGRDTDPTDALNELTDILAISPESISEESVFETAAYILK